MCLKQNYMTGIRVKLKIRRKNLKYAAFSLVELMVSMGIIVMLSVLFTANYRESNKRTDLVMAAQVMVTDMRYAQSNALGLIAYGENFPSGGWGIHASNFPGENDRYIIFADLNRSDLYDAGEAEERYGGRIIYLPKNIRIKDITTSTYISSNPSTIDISFLPPDPTTRIIHQGTKQNNINIVLENTASGVTKGISVNFLGLIEVID